MRPSTTKAPEFLQNIHKTPHAARCTLHAARCTLHAARCTLHAARCTLHAARCTLHAARCTLHAARCTLHAARCTLHAARCTLHYDMIPTLNTSLHMLRGGRTSWYGARDEFVSGICAVSIRSSSSTKRRGS